MSSTTTVRTRSSCLLMARGEKRPETSLRCCVCRGSSLLIIEALISMSASNRGTLLRGLFRRRASLGIELGSCVQLLLDPRFGLSRLLRLLDLCRPASCNRTRRLAEPPTRERPTEDYCQDRSPHHLSRHNQWVTTLAISAVRSRTE